MKMKHSTQRKQGFTFVEVLLILVIVGILAAVLLPALSRSKARESRMNCVANLKIVGLALRMWSNDHGDKFPWFVSTNQDGTMELAGSPDVFRHFLALSNELNSPKVLTCPDDKARARVIDFAQFTDKNLSYFLGLDADEGRPQTILSGDRNILGGAVTSNGLWRFDFRSQPGWGSGIHNGYGNIALGDGSAQQVTPAALRNQLTSTLTNTGLPFLRLAIPQ